MVDVGLQADVSGYVQGIGQAVAATRQYVDVADGLNGRLADLNKGFVGLTQRLTGFAKINTVALDQAALYQKQLSRIESSAVITGRSFESLSKSTRNIAKTMTGNLGEAVQVVESLQAAGIKSETQIDRLGKSFVRLGKATGVNSAMVGTEFLQLSRTMGNGISQFEKLSDSLVSTTARIGGSVPSVVAFSKALAPVAATVGLSQTAVIGLSTAMSRLGEDGYQSANSLNKVLLDMNRAIRDGGPELKAYADLMGITTTRLRDMFKSNPADVVTAFSEAVAKEGPNISRTLEALGFDSVRTTRSLTALARGGGPREAIATAVAGYGDGSTARAAEVEMDGLLDQSARLQESMSQVVRNVGAPLMGVAKYQLMAANAASNVVESATSSEPAKAAFGGLGVMELGGDFMKAFLSVAGTAAVAKIGYDIVKRMVGRTSFGSDFSQAMGQARAGAPMPADAPRGARAAYALAAPDSALMSAPGKAAQAMVRGSSAMTQAAASLTQLFNGNTFRQAMGNEPVRTPQYQALQDEVRRTRDLVSAGEMTRMERAGALARSAAGVPVGWARQPFGTSLGNLGRALVDAPVEAARFAGGAARYAGGRLGALGSLAPFGMAGLGVTAAIAGGMVLYGKKEEQDARNASMADASDDVYQAYNSFAEAAGMAGKGMASFNGVVRKTTQQIVAQNDSLSKAFTLTSEELAQATSAGYKPAFEIKGTDKSAKQVAAQALAMLPGSARPEDIAQVAMDITAQTSPTVASQALDIIKSQATRTGTGKASLSDAQVTRELLRGISANQDFLGLGNQVQTDLGMLLQTSGQQRAIEAGSVYGGTASFGGVEVGLEQVVATAEAKRIYDEAKKGRNFLNAGQGSADAGVLNKVIAEQLGLSDEEAIRYGFGSSLRETSGVLGMLGLGSNLTNPSSSKDSFEELIMQYAKDVNAPGGIKAAAALFRSGYDVNSTDYSRFSSAAPASETSAKGVETSFNEITGAGSKLADALYGAERAAREFGTVPTELNAEQRRTLGYAQGKVLDYEMNPTSSTKDAAARSLLGSAGGSNPMMALMALMMQAESAPPGYKQDVSSRAVELYQRDTLTTQYAGTNAPKQALDAYLTGQAAQRSAAGMTPSQYSQVSGTLNTTIQQGQQGAAELQNQFTQMVQGFGAMTTAIAQVRRSSGISAGAVARDARLNEQYAREDNRLQRRYALADRARAERVTLRDAGISEQRARDQFNRSEGYAQQDFNTAKERMDKAFARQELYALQDFNRQKRYLNEDASTQALRAERQFNTQVSRSNRDFQIGQERSLMDFNRGRLRMTADYGKQVARMSEDAARSMYDPYKRIAAQMVMDAGQLAANLSDQTQALDKQVENLASARSMGLSDQAIRQLGLSDSQNAQQLSRLLEDARQSPDYVQQLNDAVAAKARSADALFKDAGNTTFTRGEEDFATSMSRGAEDFATSTARAKADFSTSMSDMLADYRLSVEYANADLDRALARMTEQYQVGRERNLAQFDTDREYMTADFQRDRERAATAFALQLKIMGEDVARALHDMEVESNKSLRRAEAALEVSLERMRTRAANAISDIGAQAAAQIQSMQESFFGKGQNAAGTLQGVSQQIVDILGGMPREDLGDAQRAFLDNAMAVLADMQRERSFERNRMPGASKPWTPGSGQRSSDAAEAGYTPKKSPIAALADEYRRQLADISTSSTDEAKRRLSQAWAGIGSAAVEGFKQGFFSLGTPSNPLEWVNAAIAGLVTSVKTLLGIESPSRVFTEIGSMVVEGFKQGLATLSDLDFAGDVERAFDKARRWILNLGSSIGDWVGDRWEALTKPLERVDIGATVQDAFDDARTWLGALASRLGEWIGDGWSGLWSKLPTKEQALERIKGVFVGEDGTFQGWLKGLPDWMTETIPGVDRFLETLAPLTDAFKAAFSMIIDLWNKMDLSLSVSWDGFTIPRIPEIKAGDKVIFPGAGPWNNLGAFRMGPTPDLFPNIPNPFKEAPKARAMGGIITRPEVSLIAEAGYPEAVIPLNDRGAAVLAATMARYVDHAQAQSAMVTPYASSVVNNYSSSVIDQRTQFTGAITVKSDNPDEMAARLAAKARRRALAQPIGAR